MKVSQLTNRNGKAVKNQFIIEDGGKTIFQSYESVIAIKEPGKPILLDSDKWDYSVTTSKYRNQFLNDDMKGIKNGIKEGRYILKDLN